MSGSEEIENLQRLLFANRRTIVYYLEQKVLFADTVVTANIVFGLQNAWIEIDNIKQLLRDKGVTVDDYYEDGLYYWH